MSQTENGMKRLFSFFLIWYIQKLQQILQ